MAHTAKKPFVDISAKRRLVDKAILDALQAREAVFDLGDEDLILLADALLCGIAQAGRGVPSISANGAEPIALAA